MLPGGWIVGAGHTSPGDLRELEHPGGAVVSLTQALEVLSGQSLDGHTTGDLLRV